MKTLADTRDITPPDTGQDKSFVSLAQDLSSILVGGIGLGLREARAQGCDLMC